MTPKTKRIIIFLSVLFGALVIAYFSINAYVENRISKALEKLPNHIELKFEDFNIDLLGGNFNVSKPLLKIKGRTTGEVNAQVALEKFMLTDFKYWDYLVNDTMSTTKLSLVKPEIRYYHNTNIKDSSYSSSSQDIIQKAFKIGQIEVADASVAILNIENDSIIFQTEGTDFSIYSIAINPETIKAKIPIEYERFSLKTNELKYRLNPYEDLFISEVNISDSSSLFSGLKLKTKYGRKEHSSMLKYERDHYNVEIASIEINGQDFGFEKDSIFKFRSENIAFEQPKLQIYRDKLVEDDETRKSLYSKMLRNMNIHLDLPMVQINNGIVIYEERVKHDNVPGELFFGDLNANIFNLGNTYNLSEKTQINIDANFMENTPFSVDWSYDVNNFNDDFTFKAQMGKLRAEAMNQFMKPNLNVKLEGEILKTYFTISGNANTGNIDLKIDYEEFDVVILQKDGKQKNKLISGIVNLFVSKNSESKPGDFRFGYGKNIERDKTKSVFNFIWLNVKEGLKSAMTGSGKKK